MKQNRKNMVSIFLIIAVLGSAMFFLYGSFGSNSPAIPPPIDVDTDGDGNTDTSISVSTIQPLYVRYTDGTSSWKYPTSRTELTPMGIYDTNPTKRISSIQGYVYATVSSDKAVSNIVYTADGSIDIYDDSKSLYKHVATMPLSYTINNLVNGEDTYIISSTMTEAQFMSIVVPSGVSFDYYLYYVVSLSDISVKVTFTDGTMVNLGLTGVQATTNQLWWRFRLIQSGTVMEIIGDTTEWVWK